VPQRRDVLRLCRQGYATQTIAAALKIPHFEVVAYLRDRSAAYWSRTGDGWAKEQIEEPAGRQPGDPTRSEIAAMTAAIRKAREQPEVAAERQDDMEPALTEWRRFLSREGVFHARNQFVAGSRRVRRRPGE